MRPIALSLGLLLAPLANGADFEIKGIAPGMQVPAELGQQCTAVANADSGIPGLSCQTTLGGSTAQMRVIVHEKQIVGVVVVVSGAMMGPVLDALSEKYGRPIQHNRYMREYQWSAGGRLLGIKEDSIERGYSVILYDKALYQAARDALKNKARGDI